MSRPVGRPPGTTAAAGRTPSALQVERETYRRGQSRRSTLAALASTTAFAAVLWVAVRNAPGWPRVQASFFDLDQAIASFPRILEGFWLNVRVLAVVGVSVVVIGLAVAAIRTLRGPLSFPLRLLAAAYTDLFRGLPLIIVLLTIGFGVPGLRLQGVPTSAVVLGGVALTLTYGAYVAEVFRAGIQSVHSSQRAAARSLGLTHRQTLRLVVLPQAVRRVLPPLLNDFVALQKDVGLISVLGAVDAVRAAQIESAGTFGFTPYLVAALLFVLLAVPSARIADAVERRMARSRDATGVA